MLWVKYTVYGNWVQAGGQVFVEPPLALPLARFAKLLSWWICFIALWKFRAYFLRAQLLVIAFSRYYNFFCFLAVRICVFYFVNAFWQCSKTNCFFSFHSVTHYVFVNFLLRGIGVSTINTHTDGWLFEYGSLSMPCINSMWFAMAAFEVSIVMT